MRNTADDLRYRDQLTVPITILIRSQEISKALTSLRIALKEYLARPRTKLSHDDQQSAKVLTISLLTHSIIADTCLSAEESIYDRFDAEFDEILMLSAYIISSYKHTGDQSSGNVYQFSLDQGIIYPLYFAATKCRHRGHRRRAMELLRAVTWQEGVWSAPAMLAIAEKAINAEQEGISAVSRPREFRRVHSIDLEIDPKRRRAKVMLRQKLNGLDGEWNDRTEWATW